MCCPEAEHLCHAQHVLSCEHASPCSHRQALHIGVCEHVVPCMVNHIDHHAGFCSSTSNGHFSTRSRHDSSAGILTP